MRFDDGFLLSNEGWQALGSVATFVVAVLVFLEARAIRRTEWLARLNQSWTEFNRTVVEHADTTRIGDIIGGKPIVGELTTKETFLLFQFFDVMSSEYNALRANLLIGDYVFDSFFDSAAVLRANSPWIVDLVAQRGYEASFVRALKVLAETPNDRAAIRRGIRREIFISSRLVRAFVPRSPKALLAASPVPEQPVSTGKA